jgi:ornithine carbamoyltransferase
MLADILTMRDHIRKPLAEVSYCYLGDGRNNTASSLLVTGALLGMDLLRHRRLRDRSGVVAPAHVAPGSARAQAQTDATASDQQ